MSLSPIVLLLFVALLAAIIVVCLRQTQAAQVGAGGIFSWLLDFSLQDLRLPIINLWVCRIAYVISCVAAVSCPVLGTLILFINGASERIEPMVAVFVSALTWVGALLFIIVVRLACEWYIIMFDWIVETTKAARRYNEEKAEH